MVQRGFTYHQLRGQRPGKCKISLAEPKDHVLNLKKKNLSMLRRFKEMFNSLSNQW